MTQDPGAPGRSTSVGSIVLVGLLVGGTIGGVVTAAVLTWVDAQPDDPSSSGSSSDPSAGSSLGTSSGVVGAPAWLRSDESYVESTVQPDGKITVTHWISAESPLERVVLSLPDTPGVTALAAVEVQVQAGGRQATGPIRVDSLRATYTFAPSTQVRVRYVLTGALERSGSAARRALATATSLQVSYAPAATREVRVVRALEVLSLACTATAESAPEPCGQEESEDQWRIELTGTEVSDRVIAQITVR